ncbi:MAG: helix-turn-helix domain-containing protein, partial [bacterium]
RRHFPGGLLWVPRQEYDRAERAELVARLIEKGVPVKEVAALAKLTPRHVYRLVRERGQNRPPEDRKPEEASEVSSIGDEKGDDAQ